MPDTTRACGIHVTQSLTRSVGHSGGLSEGSRTHRSRAKHAARRNAESARFAEITEIRSRGNQRAMSAVTSVNIAQSKRACVRPPFDRRAVAKHAQTSLRTAKNSPKMANLGKQCEQARFNSNRHSRIVVREYSASSRVFSPRLRREVCKGGLVRCIQS